MLNNFSPLKLRCSNHKCQIQKELLTWDFRHFTTLFSMSFKNIISWAHYQLYWHVSILLRHFDFWDEYHRPFLRVDLNLIYCFFMLHHSRHLKYALHFHMNQDFTSSFYRNFTCIPKGNIATFKFIKLCKHIFESTHTILLRG